MPSVLSIQSFVAYGHVGNSAAVFPLQKLGIDVWPVPTVILSNHPGHGAFRGHRLSRDQVAELLLGMEERGVLGSADALLTGYLGDPSLGPLVIDTLSKLHPKAVYACDPVMGDHGGFFVDRGLPPFFKDQALEHADILTPNLFELGYLSGCPVGSLSEIEMAARTLLARGPSLVLVTSVETGSRADEIGMIAVSREGSFGVFTPKFDIRLNGTGDCLTAITLAHHLKGAAVPELLGRVASSLFGLVQATHKSRSKELCLIVAQREITEPSRTFEAFAL